MLTSTLLAHLNGNAIYQIVGTLTGLAGSETLQQAPRRQLFCTLADLKSPVAEISTDCRIPN